MTTRENAVPRSIGRVLDMLEIVRNRAAEYRAWFITGHLEMLEDRMDEQSLIHDWNEASTFDWSSVGEIQLDDETLRDGLQNPSVVDPSMLLAWARSGHSLVPGCGLDEGPAPNCPWHVGDAAGAVWSGAVQAVLRDAVARGSES